MISKIPGFAQNGAPNSIEDYQKLLQEYRVLYSAKIDSLVRVNEKLSKRKDHLERANVRLEDEKENLEESNKNLNRVNQKLNDDVTIFKIEIKDANTLIKSLRNDVVTFQKDNAIMAKRIKGLKQDSLSLNSTLRKKEIVIKELEGLAVSIDEKSKTEVNALVRKNPLMKNETEFNAFTQKYNLLEKEIKILKSIESYNTRELEQRHTKLNEYRTICLKMYFSQESLNKLFDQDENTRLRSELISLEPPDFENSYFIIERDKLIRKLQDYKKNHNSLYDKMLSYHDIPEKVEDFLKQDIKEFGGERWKESYPFLAKKAQEFIDNANKAVKNASESERDYLKVKVLLAKIN